VGLTGWKRLKYSLLLNDSPTFLNLFRDTVNDDWQLRVLQFERGCINPTVVVDVQNRLVATFTNLASMPGEPTPVIKISKERLDLITNVEVYDGLRLPSVAIYVPHTDHGWGMPWKDFDPKVANCFTNSKKDCQRLLSKLPANAWKCLELGLEQVPDKKREGLYPVKLDSHLVNNSY
jgi:hypothetical protein